MSVIVLDEAAWDRVASAVRWVEDRQRDRPAEKPSGGRQTGPPNLYEVTAVDTSAGTCTVQVVADADGTLLGEIGQIEDVEYQADVVPCAGQQGLMVRLASGAVMFFPFGARDPGEDVDIIGTEETEGNEAADETEWPGEEPQGLEFWVQTRTAYFNAGDEILYGYKRKIVIDRAGRIVSIGPETRVIIEIPQYVS